MSTTLQRQQWLATRQTGIGGSDVAAICGLSPWQTPYDIYLAKTEEIDDSEPTEPQRWGTLLEPLIRQRYCDVTGHQVFTPQQTFRHPEHDWMIANLDGIVDTIDGILECKSSRMGEGWGEPGTDEVPDWYMPQVQHYTCVTGLPRADVAVLVGGNDFRIYHVEADPEWHDALIAIGQEFWQRVLDRNPPDPTSLEDVKRRWPSEDTDGLVQANDEIADRCRDLLCIRADIAESERIAEQHELAIKKAIGAAAGVAIGDQVLATWKASKPIRKFDVKAFQDAMPDLFEEFCEECPGSRRFLLKQPKKVKAKKK